MDKFLNSQSAEKVAVCCVVVQQARPVSEAVAQTTGIKHESPQVLMIRNGKCVWHTSHRRITAEALVEATEKY